MAIKNEKPLHKALRELLLYKTQPHRTCGECKFWGSDHEERKNKDYAEARLLHGENWKRKMARQQCHCPQRFFKHKRHEYYHPSCDLFTPVIKGLDNDDTIK